MIHKRLGLPEEYRAQMHGAFYDAQFCKRPGDDSYRVSGSGTRSGKELMIYAMLAEDGEDSIDILREVENMLWAHLWLLQEGCSA